MGKKLTLDNSSFIRFWLVTTGFILGAVFIFRAWTGLIIVGLAIFLALSIRPLGNRINSIFTKKGGKDKEKLSNILAFLMVVALIVVATLLIFPVVFSETSKFVGQIPQNFEKFLGGWDGINDFGKTIGIENMRGEIMEWISTTASSFAQNVGNLISSIGNVFSIILMSIILSIFFLLEGPALYERLWRKLEGRKKDEKIAELRRLVSRMANVVSSFMGGQVTIALLDGGMVALIVFCLSFFFGYQATLALPIGLISMLFYLIPMFGQFIGCAVNALILMASDPLAGLIFALIYLVFAQVEGNVVAPHIQGNAMRLSPLIVLVAVIVGTYAFGLIGAIIAIPVAGCIKVLLEEYPRIKELREKNE